MRKLLRESGISDIADVAHSGDAHGDAHHPDSVSYFARVTKVVSLLRDIPGEEAAERDRGQEEVEMPKPPSSFWPEPAGFRPVLRTARPAWVPTEQSELRASP